MTTRRLWQLVLIAALLQVAVPALRELVPLWLRAPFSSRSVGMEGRCWPRPPPPTGELGALARVDYSLPADPPRIWQAFETALARAPGSEALLIERARRIPLTQAAWARRAALAVTDAFPDNAAGWYLLAAADLAAGDRAATFAAVRRGNRAPRYEGHVALAMQARMARLMSTGLPEFESRLRGGIVDDTTGLRCGDLAKQLSAARLTSLERLELVAMGARLRDGGESIDSSFSGWLLQARLYNEGRGSGTPEARRRSANCLAANLRREQHADLAAWVEADIERHVAYPKRAGEPRSVGPIDALTRCCTVYYLLAWWILPLRFAAWVVLVGCLVGALTGWLPAGDECRVPRFAAWVVVGYGACTALALAAFCLRAPSPVWPSHGLQWLLLGSAPLPLVAGLLCARRTHQPARTGLVTIAALLVLAGWTAQLPAAAARRAATRYAILVPQDDLAERQRAMDAAAPCRLLPANPR